MRMRSFIFAGVAAIVLVWGVVGTVAWVASRNAAPTVPTGRLTQMEMSGDMESMLQQHEQMLEMMQTDASPAMLARMKSDPMTQMMQSGEMIRLAEEHRAQIDCMIGRQPCGR